MKYFVYIMFYEDTKDHNILILFTCASSINKNQRFKFYDFFSLLDGYRNDHKFSSFLVYVLLR